MPFTKAATLLFLSASAFVFTVAASAQQTLGRINGSVTDTSGAVIGGTEIAVTNNQTGATRQVSTQGNGAYLVQDLPIGTYSLSFSHEGFDTSKFPSIQVQADRSTTLNVQLKPGSVTTSIVVAAMPLLNSVDTTNGYVLDSAQIASRPLGTGSFTQLATLSPGVSADLLSDTGTNTGLGNQNIWANGQRLSSNTFTFNSVMANNLFNGASSSQVSANRAVLNTGESFQNGGTIKTNTSIYDAIGQALPTPPQETISEMRVNTSMFDVSQGDTAGAHVDVTTKSGTNAFHGALFGTLGNVALNADPFFFKQNSLPTPDLHRYDAGASVGGPIKRDKLFFYTAYQYTRATDQLNSLSQLHVPSSLTDDRSPSGLAPVLVQAGLSPTATIDPVALKYLQAKAPNGSLLIPSPTTSDPNAAFNVTFVGPTSIFLADRALLNIDYNLTKTDTLSGKYYYQHDPTTSPFSSTPLLGFPQTFNSGSQVFSLENTKIFNPKLSWDQKFGFLRMKIGSFTSQPFGPDAVGINVFGSPHLPAVSVRNFDTNFNSLDIGPGSNFANTGFAQNTFEGTTNLNWVLGRHTLSFGANYDYTQLNILNRASQVASIGFNSLADFLQGGPLRSSSSAYFVGPTNRYYRAPQVGAYAQDKWQLTPSLVVTAGVRYDYDGGLYEKYGHLVNFDATKYQYNLSTDTIENSGLIVAGNNKQYATPGASDSTLKQRQWGIAPRVGLAYSPTPAIVWRAGFGMYYDRGEYFTNFSPSAGFGFNGPFGVTLQPPFVQQITATSSSTFENPFGATLPPVDNNPADFINNLPNQAALINGASPYLFGAYGINNKLPYTENWSLDWQWQVRPDIAVTVGYTGNHGVRQTIPLPFNQPLVATPTNPVNGQIYSYGYNAVDSNGNNLATEPYNTSTGGNTDLRTPYIGYSPNSVAWTTAGISHYNGLLTSAQKSFRNGLDFMVSYTWSHSLDESSGYGLFYNGNDPRNLRSGYASSDYDRTNVVTISYDYQLPKFSVSNAFANKLVNGWGMSSIIVFESGQPYNVYDFSGTVGGIYFASNDFLTNPVLPLGPGVKPSQALTGHSGAFANFNGATVAPDKVAFKPTAFAYPSLQPGESGVPPCGPSTAGAIVCDTYESTFGKGGRNIFRGDFQKRADVSIFKETRIHEAYNLRFSIDFFNISNTPSFDTPGNNFTGSDFNNPPGITPLGPNAPSDAFSSQGVGVITNPLGSPRQIQFTGKFTF
ncbi:TonB-dependent receptor domain-containing protein [Alloacidobacterium sp.]|uniref:TonB-dependent receptor domain-containing protein n=1 Tax=Alloacidobacterium sp. TaxID=2951999 RepID=UPI002D4C01F2|nr:TonB-dependent receptor [Alloacidobacterium sp.]HYK37421.1 TonB-dependent receptor [Alloacidobacterium sp.]